jgi:uncharacterized phage infection (PIP) family protein YhgE
MDVEKLTKDLQKIAAGPDGPAQFAKFTTEVVEKLKKAADHLGKAAKAIGKAIETHDKMGEHMDGMASHLDNMKDCMGKAIASGKLGKVEDAGEAKDMTTHMSGMETHHGALDKLITSQEEHLDNAEGAIDDAVDSADEESDKGLAAAERTEKRYNRKLEAFKKQATRENARGQAALVKQLTAKADAQITAVQDGFNQLLKALAPVPAAPPHIEKTIPVRTVSLEKAADGARQPVAGQPGPTPVAKVATGAEIPATDEYGMPNPEYLKAVESGQLGNNGGSAFLKSVKEVPAQVGNPFPEQFGNAA